MYNRRGQTDVSYPVFFIFIRRRAVESRPCGNKYLFPRVCGTLGALRPIGSGDVLPSKYFLHSGKNHSKDDQCSSLIVDSIWFEVIPHALMCSWNSRTCLLFSLSRRFLQKRLNSLPLHHEAADLSPFTLPRQEPVSLFIGPQLYRVPLWRQLIRDPASRPRMIS